MTEWWYVKGKDLPITDPNYRGSSAAGSNALANQRAFAKEGTDDIEQVFRGFTDSLASTTTVTGARLPGREGHPGHAQRRAGRRNYSPYQSSQGTGSTAPGTLLAKPRGWVRLLDSTGTEVTRKRVTRAGTTSFELGSQNTLGSGVVHVQYLGRGELIDPSSKVVAFDVVKPATTTTVTGPDEHHGGRRRVFTATVTPSTATGTVTLTGLPGGAVTGTLTDGVPPWPSRRRCRTGPTRSRRSTAATPTTRRARPPSAPCRSSRTRRPPRWRARPRPPSARAARSPRR